MAQIPIPNRFYRGIDSDSGYFERDGQTYLDAQNVRLLRREGQSSWMASLGGTEIHIELPPTYTPVATYYYQGLLFMLIHSELTNSDQIGTFPSPNPLNNFEYDRVYRPWNWTQDAPWTYIGTGCETVSTPNVQPLQSVALGFELDRGYRVVCRGESDGSVTMYWTDGVQPIRLANSCFDIITGRPTGRYLSQLELISGQWDLVNENTFHPTYTLLGVTTGGQMKAGHVFVMIRYTDTQYSATSFLNFSSPIAIFNSTGGGVPIGGESDTTTDKQIQLLIQGLDPNAALLEVAYIRYLSQDEYEANIVASRYVLDGSGTLQVNLTGREALIPLSIDEAIALKPYDSRTAFDIEQLNNTLYIANLKGVQVDHPDLRELACLLYLDEHTEEVGTVGLLTIGQNQQVYGIDQNDVFEKVGYFSGETYAFAILPVLKSGFYGIPIPIHGTDHYTGTSIGQNDKGAFRFTQSNIVPYWNDVTIKATAKAIVLLSGSPAVGAYIANSQWIQDNVIGFYLCRANRRENLLYEGLSLYGFNGKIALNAHKEFGYTGTYSSEFYSDYISPLFEAAMFGIAFAKDSVFPVGSGDVEGFSYYGGMSNFPTYSTDDIVGKRKLCIISNDYAIAQEFVPGNVHIRRIQTTDYDVWARRFDSSNLNNVVTNPSSVAAFGFGIPSTQFNIDSGTIDGLGTQHFVGYDQMNANFSTVSKFQTEAVNVPLWSAAPVGSGRFVSRREEGSDAQQTSFYFLSPNTALFIERNKEFSLPIANPSYIGIEDAPLNIHPYSNDNPWNRAVVGVYRSDPDNLQYAEIYNPTTETYYPIGDFMPISTFGNTDHIRWQGDCFIGRVYTRLVSGHSESIGADLTDLIAQKEAVVDPLYPPIKLENGWGYWVSYIAQHSYNQQCRIEKGRNLYYPASGIGDEGKGFSWKLDSPESNLYNTSYRRMLAGRGFFSLDPLQPISSGKFETRIRASFKHITGAVRDGYRQFAETDKIDLEYSNGPIRGIHAITEYLYSVQESAINLHPISERIQNSTDKGTTFVQGGVQKLPPYWTHISDKLGSQHRKAMVVGLSGLYGYDYRRRTWWRVQGTQVEDLTLTRKAQSWLYQHLPIPLLSDRVGDKADMYLLKKGIQMVSYGEYGQIWMTIYGEEPKTLVFNEMLDAFEMRVDINPTLYAPMSKELVSFNGDNLGHLHEQGDDLVLYGELHEGTIRFVCGQQGEEVKHWDAMILNANNRPLREIRYETQHQKAVQVFDNPNEFWYKPYYRENQWKQSIRRADSTVEPELNIFGDDSPLRGQYLIVDLSYMQPRRWWLQEVKVLVTQSKA